MVAPVASRVSPDRRSAYEKVVQAADRARPSFQLAYEAFWEDRRRALNVTELALRLEQDGPRAVVVPWDDYQLDLTNLYVRHLGTLAKSVAIAAVQELIPHPARFDEPILSPGAGMTLEFRLRLIRAEEYLASPEFGRLLTTLTFEERETVRRLMETSFAKGVAPFDTAAQIRQSLGFPVQYALALQRYEQNLAVTDPVRRARLVDRYQARLSRYRAETIARTETIRAANVGQLRTWQEAVSSGLLPEGRTRRVWIVTPDDRLCAYCQDLRSETATLRGVFRVGSLYVTTPPAHPRCRCAMGLVFE